MFVHIIGSSVSSSWLGGSWTRLSVSICSMVSSTMCLRYAGIAWATV